MSRILTFSIIAASTVAGLARADVFVMTHGGQIEGKLVNTEQSPRNSYVVETTTGQITLPADQVEKVVSLSAAEAHYEALLPRMPANADGNWKMAEWCGKFGLTEQRERHLEKVLEYDPENKSARYALGYSHLDGQWIRAEEYMASRGYIRHKGAWRLPQEVALEESSTNIELQEKEWRKNIKMWRTAIVKGRGQSEEALQNLRALNDPLAAAGLADLIAEEEFPQMKLILIEALGRLRSPIGIATFADLALHDADKSVRDKAIDQLLNFGGEQAVPPLVRGLGDKDNLVVNRAGIALGSIGDPAATVPLIDALSTKHKFVVNTGGGGGTNAGFSNDGGGSFTQGGGPKLIEQELPNRGVLEGLSAIHRGVNFQFDKQRWKDWYAKQRSPDVVNLRRD